MSRLADLIAAAPPMPYPPPPEDWIDGEHRIRDYLYVELEDGPQLLADSMARDRAAARALAALSRFVAAGGIDACEALLTGWDKLEETLEQVPESINTTDWEALRAALAAAEGGA